MRCVLFSVPPNRHSPLDSLIQWLTSSSSSRSVISFRSSIIHPCTLQSEHTFTGISKPAVFSEHADEPRFARFKHKLVHHVMPPPAPGTPPFDYEADHRRAMTILLNQHGANSLDNTTLVIMADVDELPSAQTIRLLKGCEGWGAKIHLLLRNFIYSYEWELVNPSWRAAVQTWSQDVWYGHSATRGQGELQAIADSGWHCRSVFSYRSF
jgi:beta-1,4-mannosyl-glycoprotein beta-1,4-N-acetylglucosaminyltransferase